MNTKFNFESKNDWVFWLLTAALIVLKLEGKITISWWWVFSPLWIPFCVAFVGFFITLFIQAIKEHFKSSK